MARATPGQTVILRGGVYREEVLIRDKHGSANAYITVRSHPNEVATIETEIGRYGIFLRGSTSYLRIACLDLAGPSLRPAAIPPHENYTRDLVFAGASYDQNPLNFGVGISIGQMSDAPRQSHHHIDLIGNRVHDYSAGGISAIGSNHLRIVSNDVYRNARYSCYSGSGISILWSMNVGGANNGDGYSSYLVGNRTWQNENRSNQCFSSDRGAIKTDGNGIILDYNNQFADFSGRTLVANNLSYSNGGAGIVVFNSPFVDIVNNTSYLNLQTPDLNGGGVHPEIGTLWARDLRLYNNLVVARDGMQGIDDPRWPQAANLILSAAAAAGVLQAPSTDQGANFAPRAGSSPVNAGVAISAVPNDYYGRSRRGAPDIGAIETG